jgi:hypothetical protein
VLQTFSAQLNSTETYALPTQNNEPGGKMVWYPREMKRTNVSGVYPSLASGGLGQDYREEE